MPRRNIYLITAGVVLFALGLLLRSFTARALVAGIILLVTAVWLDRVFSTDTSTTPSTVADDDPDDASSPETFARGKLFAATMSGMREGLLVVDKDMRVVASNQAAHQLFNLSRGKLEAQRLTELTRNPAIYSAFLDGLKGLERSGVRVETHGPERQVFDLRVVPLGIPARSPRISKGPEGVQYATAAEGALGVFIDVTRSERLENVRQEFLSNVSHELRTPLTAIMAFVETLEAGALDDPESARRFLAIIRKNATRMENLISDILELSAIEAGNVAVHPEPVALAPLVDEVISLLVTQAGEQTVTLINLVAREVTVFADARRLEQMLTNLLENAIKFNRAGGQVTIEFETAGSSRVSRSPIPDTLPSSPRVSKGPLLSSLPVDPPPRDRIIITDTGEGIPAQHLERLFERFYRVDRARSPALGGTGLGLAIVKHLARAHDGEVTVTSGVGKGSTFTIELPRREGS
jgi:two-component system phosphate regulon sensor histidine kinase PhoR